MQGRLTLQERLVVLVLAAILPLAGLSVWFVSREVESTTELARSQLRFTASAVAAGQDSVIDSVHHLLGAVVAMPELRGLGAEACVRQLAALRDRYPIYGNMGVADPQGRGLDAHVTAAQPPGPELRVAQFPARRGLHLLGRGGGDVDDPRRRQDRRPAIGEGSE